MTDSIDYEAMRALALHYRGVVERIANVRVPPPPSNLNTEAERIAYRMGVEAMKDAVSAAKQDQ